MTANDKTRLVSTRSSWFSAKMPAGMLLLFALLLGLRGLGTEQAHAQTSLAGSSVDSGNRGVIVFQGNPSWTIATRPPSIITPATIPDASTLDTIYSNLGPKNKAYYDKAGFNVFGPDAREGGPVWIGVPFTPKSNAEVTEIETAVQWGKGLGGRNAVVISLNKDSGGLPGDAIHTWNLKDLPVFPSCCKLDIAMDKGLKVEKGKQYWVVASTSAKAPKTDNAWDFNYKETTGVIAYSTNLGAYWATINAYPVAALGVFGHKIN